MKPVKYKTDRIDRHNVQIEMLSTYTQWRPNSAVDDIVLLSVFNEHALLTATAPLDPIGVVVLRSYHHGSTNCAHTLQLPHMIHQLLDLPKATIHSSLSPASLI